MTAFMIKKSLRGEILNIGKCSKRAVERQAGTLKPMPPCSVITVLDLIFAGEYHAENTYEILGAALLSLRYVQTYS